MIVNLMSTPRSASSFPPSSVHKVRFFFFFFCWLGTRVYSLAFKFNSPCWVWTGPVIRDLVRQVSLPVPIALRTSPPVEDWSVWCDSNGREKLAVIRRTESETGTQEQLFSFSHLSRVCASLGSTSWSTMLETP